MKFLFALILVPSLAAAQAAPAVWAGLYQCAQGPTSLTLTVRPKGDGNGAEALFHFSADAANPGVPEGCFAMTGTYDAKHVHLQPGDWLLHPAGYVTVGLDGDIAYDGRSISGHVSGPGCTVFSLTLVKRDPGVSRCGHKLS